MRRVLVIGPPGAGKSTFASALARRTGLPLVSLDEMFWKPGWAQSGDAEFDARLAQCLQEPGWIMEGNYRRTLDWRCAYAGTVILFRRSRWLCLWRVLRRLRAGTQQARGCPQRVSLNFVKYIVWTYPRSAPAEVAALRARHAHLRWITLDSDAAAARLLERGGLNPANS